MKKFLTIDIGGTYVKFALIDRSGKIGDVRRVETPASLIELQQLFHQILTELPVSIYGIAISCPGKIDVKQGIVYNGGALPYLHRFNFKEFIEKNYHYPCSVCNDGKAAALSELWLGNLQGIDQGAAIVLGTGVGGGLIVNGEILQGPHFQAGELSFMPRKSQSCHTEDLLGFSASAVQLIATCSSLMGLENREDGLAVFALLEAGASEPAREQFEIYCREIVHIILNLQAILDIQKVVIGGGISRQPLLIQTIQEQYQYLLGQSKIFRDSIEPVAIEPCKFGNEANLLGALYQLLLAI